MNCHGNTNCPTHVITCTCNGDGLNLSPCPTNVTTWTDTLETGTGATNITSDQISELKDAITNEYARRKNVYDNHKYGINKGYNPNLEDKTQSSDFDTPIYNDTSVEIEIQDEQIEELYQDINFLKSMIWPSNVDEDLNGQKIEANQYYDLRNNINDCENDCLCDCDYCSCDCNNCPCNCHYCTCDCNNCSCVSNDYHCNHEAYTCPCWCNNSKHHDPSCRARGCTILGGW